MAALFQFGRLGGVKAGPSAGRQYKRHVAVVEAAERFCFEQPLHQAGRSGPSQSRDQDKLLLRLAALFAPPFDLAFVQPAVQVRVVQSQPVQQLVHGRIRRRPGFAFGVNQAEGAAHRKGNQPPNAAKGRQVYLLASGQISRRRKSQHDRHRCPCPHQELKKRHQHPGGLVFQSL